MFTAIVLQLETTRPGNLTGATGAAVHGFWLNRWRALAPDFAGSLHAAKSFQPYTLSPLLGLPLPRNGVVTLPAGAPAWLRLTTLTAPLSARLREQWLTGLPGAVVAIAGLDWRVSAIVEQPAANPWSGAVDPHGLAGQALRNAQPPGSWDLEFLSPTTFHMAETHLPFPLPGLLVQSWLRRWNEFGPIALPEDLANTLEPHLAVSAYHLKTVPVHDRRKIIIGCVGSLTLQALDLLPTQCAALDLLCRSAFWLGSGQYTPQGMGMTRVT